jgi:hypothetical protein
LAVLLRRFADEIDARQIQPMDILDMTVASKITEVGPWWSATLYWSPDEESEATRYPRQPVPNFAALNLSLPFGAPGQVALSGASGLLHVAAGDWTRRFRLVDRWSHVV